MEIRLDQLNDPHFVWREQLELTQDEPAHDDLLAIGPMDCRGVIDTTPFGFVLRLKLSYSRTLSCVRCLGEISSDVDQELDFLIDLSLDSKERAEEETELDRDDLGVISLSEPVLDTRPVVIEQAQLAIPMKPLCKKDCAGLCGQCGSDLNEGACGCDAEVDPRWSALKGLVKS